MTEPTKYFVVTKKAVPEVLLKVVEAKRLLESGKLPTIQDAVDAVGSRTNRDFCRMCFRSLHSLVQIF